MKTAVFDFFRGSRYNGSTAWSCWKTRDLFLYFLPRNRPDLQLAYIDRRKDNRTRYFWPANFDCV